MSCHVFVSPSSVLHGIDPHRAANRCLPGQSIPADPSDSALAPTVPDQLAEIGNDDTGTVLGRLNGGDKIESRTGAGRDLADRAVSENTQVLKLFAKVDNRSLRGCEVGRGEDGDVGIVSAGFERQAGYIDTKRLHAGLDVFANATLELASARR